MSMLIFVHYYHPNSLELSLICLICLLLSLLFVHAASQHDIERIIGILVEESEIDFENIDYRKLGKYLAIHLSPETDQVDRIHSALKSSDLPPPSVYMMFKDHKDTKPGEPCPPTRQVCGAKEGPLARISHLVSLILTPVTVELSEKLGTECCSTEEMIRAILDANTALKSKLETSSQRVEESAGWTEQVDEEKWACDLIPENNFEKDNPEVQDRLVQPSGRDKASVQNKS